MTHSTVLDLGTQQFDPQAKVDKEAATQDFFSVNMWLLVLVPMIGAILIAALKRKKAPELPHVTDMTWKVDVEESEVPVVVHAYKSWSVGDRVIENQVKLLQEQTEGRLRVFWLDIDKNPGITSRFKVLERRSVALFRSGVHLWQCTGVHDHDDMLAEFAEALDVPKDSLETREVVRREEPVI